jgi:putative hydrolase of the HAD superfamily
MTRAVGAARDTGFEHVEVWVFDLDDTLYPPSCGLFDQIDRRMGAFIGNLLGVDAEEARRVQKELFREHGTTLRGLMDRHGIDPAPFLDFVHGVDASVLERDAELDRALGLLPGRKLIFTNGTIRHAENVVERLGIGHHFEGVFDIEAAGYRPKPEPAVYRRLVDRHGIEPTIAALFEDSARNLPPAAALGFTTVWVRPDDMVAQAAPRPSGIHHETDDLVMFLKGLVTELGLDEEPRQR